MFPLFYNFLIVFEEIFRKFNKYFKKLKKQLKIN